MLNLRNFHSLLQCLVGVALHHDWHTYDPVTTSGCLAHGHTGLLCRHCTGMFHCGRVFLQSVFKHRRSIPSCLRCSRARDIGLSGVGLLLNADWSDSATTTVHLVPAHWTLGSQMLTAPDQLRTPWLLQRLRRNKVVVSPSSLWCCSPFCFFMAVLLVWCSSPILLWSGAAFVSWVVLPCPSSFWAVLLAPPLSGGCGKYNYLVKSLL